MRLRNRIAVMTLASSAIFLPAGYFATDAWRQWQADRALAQGIETAVARGDRAKCEAHAATFGGGELQPLPPIVVLEREFGVRPQIFAYSATFESANPTAPPFPEELRAVLQSGRERAQSTFPTPGGVGRQLAVRMPWTTGPCAVFLSRFGAFNLPLSTMFFRLFIILVCFAGSALLAAGPIIARLQRLTAAVKTSADSTYRIPVPVTGPDEIGELERAFNRAGEQVKSQLAMIQERETALRSVISTTTHDVALPLTVVQGHLSALQARLPSDSPAQEGLRGAIRETHYLAALLHNLGAAARLDNAMPIVERRPLDLNELVARVVARHRPLAETLGVEIGAAVPEQVVSVDADVTLLEQAVSNLVHNAVHYNKPGGHVAVILATTDEGRRFSIRVIDDGPGIPAEERHHLTERAFRGATGRARRPEGQGLGLHIVREVVDRHGFGLRLGASEYGGTEVEIDGACPGQPQS